MTSNPETASVSPRDPGPGALLEASDVVQVAAVLDAAFVLPVGAMITSLCAKLGEGRKLCVHVVGDRLGEADWQRLEACVTGRNVSLTRIPVDARESLGPGFRTRAYDHISPVCFMRLLLPELLPGLDRVLYLDGDVIACADVGELWASHRQGASLFAAIERNDDGTPVRLLPQVRHARSLGISSDAPVFNVGVLLMDLAAWRRTRLAERAFSYLRSAGPDVRWYEQEALNVCARGEIGMLDPRWNAPPRQAGRLPPAERGFIHFLTARKPWHWDYPGPLQEAFFAAVDAGPWRGWRPVRPPLGWLAVIVRRLRKAVAKRVHAWAHRVPAPKGIVTRGEWRTLLPQGQMLVDDRGRNVDIQAVIAACECEGADAAEALEEGLDAPPLEGWAARDARDGTLFLGRTRVVPPLTAGMPPRYAARIVIARERPQLRLDADGTVIAGARVAEYVLRLRPSVPATP